VPPFKKFYLLDFDDFRFFLKMFFLSMLSLDFPESRLTDCVGGTGFDDPEALLRLARICLWSLRDPLENFLFLLNKNLDFCILTIKLQFHFIKRCSWTMSLNTCMTRLVDRHSAISTHVSLFSQTEWN